jgi:hypothetical protein
MNVQFYLEAKSKDEMITKQLENNLTRGAEFVYSTPVKEGNIWVCWFYDNFEQRMTGNGSHIR